MPFFPQGVLSFSHRIFFAIGLIMFMFHHTLRARQHLQRNISQAWVIIFLCLAAHDASAEQQLRIAVGRYNAKMSVSGPNIQVVGNDGTLLKAKGPVVLAPGEKGIVLDGKALSQSLLRIKSTALLFRPPSVPILAAWAGNGLLESIPVDE